MRLFLTILILTILASCSVLKNAGIEKRKYRPGYYFNSPSSPASATRQPEENKKDAFPVKYIKQLRNEEKKETIPIYTNTKKISCPAKRSIVHVNNIINKHLSRPNVVIENKISKKLQNRRQHGIHSWRDLLAYIIGLLLFVLIVIGLSALFPMMSIEIAMLISFVFCVLLLLLFMLVFAD
jgi:ribosomal protein L31E